MKIGAQDWRRLPPAHAETIMICGPKFTHTDILDSIPLPRPGSPGKLHPAASCSCDCIAGTIATRLQEEQILALAAHTGLLPTGLQAVLPGAVHWEASVEEMRRRDLTREVRMLMREKGGKRGRESRRKWKKR